MDIRYKINRNDVKKISYTKQYNHPTLMKECRGAWHDGARNKEEKCQDEGTK